MKRETCSNCGWELTEKNVELACEDAGVPQDELTFCCPTYTDEKGCLGYCAPDRELPAYWYTH